MARQSVCVPHHEKIIELRGQGMSVQRIADDIGVGYHALRMYIDKHGIEKPNKTREEPILQVSRIVLRKDLNKQQVSTLERMALEWGCETLAEAAVEILRDYLDENEV